MTATNKPTSDTRMITIHSQPNFFALVGAVALPSLMPRFYPTELFSVEIRITADDSLVLPIKPPVLVGIQHWCVIVGKDDKEYLARDPLRDDKEPVPLSALTEKSYAVRGVKKVE